MATLNYTPLEVIDTKIQSSRNFYLARQLQLSHEKSPAKADLLFRQTQLKKLYNSILKHEENLIQAMFQDYHRARQESIGTEINPLLNATLHIINHLSKWMKPKRVSDNSPPFICGSIKVEKIARGNVLVISPFNFPVLLALVPVAHAIGAGNSVILKPSERTAHTALVMQRIIEEAGFPDGLVQVVQGAIDETQRLITSKDLDMIFYTGSPTVGSIIAQEAAKNLTPCVLELGGKSPTFITENFNDKNLKTALKRIFFGAFGNSGQICVSPDYLLVHESKYNKVAALAKEVLIEMFPEVNDSTEFTHLISETAYNTTLKKLEATSGEKFQAKSDLSDTNICVPPTLIFNCQWEDSTMQQENFAPILPVLKYSNLDDTLDKIIATHNNPLVQYIFSDSNEEISHILLRLKSGDCVINDTILHVGIQDAPFGGIGNSGYGNYGGIYGFNAFTHERTFFKQPFWNDVFLSMRYAPFTQKKTKLIKATTRNMSSFDKNGHEYWYLNKWFPLSFLIIISGMLYKALV
ncbi:hypothetical protein NCAS_0F01510 [Naumovozyma castellii]|uniref:Aldehyde dehydrogenase n=1 Tax=Naumovozyma castellii TaxID=27288 RepID=G0VGL4_NAUCA|nr:hypothetical protein NCAS_0F01510 [Naumovozyma castellii CBS 4309]CCC70635.1 hypothetical protein NCAS_0F01510 [Naumovozyma castellii CBS 4309]